MTTQTKRASAGAKFQKGQSGNPRGRPKGSKNKATLLLQQMFDGNVKSVGQAVLKAAKGGDMIAAKLIVERLLSPMRERVVRFHLPKIQAPSDVPQACLAIVEAAARGEISPAEAASFQDLLGVYSDAAATVDHARRLDELEARLGVGGP